MPPSNPRKVWKECKNCAKDYVILCRLFLVHVAFNDHVECLELLLKHNAAADTADSQGHTPLMTAAFCGHTQTIGKCCVLTQKHAWVWLVATCVALPLCCLCPEIRVANGIAPGTTQH